MEIIWVLICFGLASYYVVKTVQLIKIAHRVSKAEKKILKEIEERYKV
jgi:hypothetical protein